MGKITEALKKVTDERIDHITRVKKKPEVRPVLRKITNSMVDEHIVVHHDPASLIGEQYKILRTNIQRLKQAKGYKVFGISSSINSEGKSITAINLAITMAHDLETQSVMLIDADMRKGKIASYLGIEHNPGLSEVLQGEIDAEAVLVTPSVDKLTIMPAGNIPKNPAELLGSHKMKEVISKFRARFDYVFVDTPPIMPLTDACILGPHIDGIVMVIQAGRTQREVIRHAETRLLQAHGKILGYVVTNVEYHLPQYLYKYVHEYSDYAYQYK